MNFQVNQIVKGKVCGVFIILGFRFINEELYAQLKCYDPKSGSTSYGELSLPVSAIENFYE